MSDNDLDLISVVEETAHDLTQEKKKDVKVKIRHVFDQLGTFGDQKKKLIKDLAKMEEKITKAQGKLAELRKGNWEVLKQINPNQKEEPEKESNNE